MEYQEALRGRPDLGAIDRLKLYKVCIRSVASRLETEFRIPPPAIDTEDRLGVTLKLIRAIEGAYFNDISFCLLRSPGLKDHVDNPYLVDGNTSRSLDRLRQHAVDLVREHAIDELGNSHADLTGGDAFRAQRARQRNTRLISMQASPWQVWRPLRCPEAERGGRR